MIKVEYINRKSMDLVEVIVLCAYSPFTQQFVAYYEDEEYDEERHEFLVHHKDIILSLSNDHDYGKLLGKVIEAHKTNDYVNLME